LTPPPVQIAYLLLCHQNVDLVIDQARALASAGDRVMIHLDRRAGRAGIAQLRAAFAGRDDIRLTRRRIACGWGGFSLIRATLLLMRSARDAWAGVTHFYLLSGDCYPLMGAADIRQKLADDPRDMIETGEYTHLGHIHTAANAQRLHLYYPVNERRHPQGFAALRWLQVRLSLKRRPPKDLPLRMGRQWWCLRRSTVDAILTLLARRPDIMRFFRWVWIPDESLFQSVIRMVVPATQINTICPTACAFTRAGTPVVFHDDHRDVIGDPEALFIRKISPQALQLRNDLLQVFQGQRAASKGDVLAQYHNQNPRHIMASHPFHAVNLSNDPYMLMRGHQLPPSADLMVGIVPPDTTAQDVAALSGALAPFVAGPAMGLVFDGGLHPLPDLGGYQMDLRRNICASLDMILRARSASAGLLFIRADDSDAIAQLAQIRPQIRLCVWPDLGVPMDLAAQNRLIDLMQQVGFDAPPLLHRTLGSGKTTAYLQTFLRLTSDQAAGAAARMTAQHQQG
jgi:hypothetical protein